VSAVTVEVVQDARFPHGGHAVIRLHGLWLLPPQAKFRIDPIEEAAPEIATDWPAGERVPKETRVTSRGVEILVGPDIVDAAALQPGTPVTISIPSASISADLRWPNLPVSSAPRRGQVIMSASELRAEIATAERLRREREQALADAEAERLARLHAEAQADKLRRERSEAASLSSLQPRGGDVMVRDDKQAQVGGAGGSSWPTGIERAAQAAQEQTRDAARPAPPRPTPAASTTATTTTGAAMASTPLMPSSQASTSTIEVTIEDPISASRNADGSLRLQPTSNNSIVTRESTVETGPHMQSLGEGSKHYQQRQMMSFGVGFLAAAGLSWLFWNGIRSELRKPAAADVQATKTQGVATAVATAATTVAVPATARMAVESGVTLKDVFSLDKVSPRGRSAVDVDLTTALKLADDGLHGAAADRQESAFWLRKSLALVLNQDEVKWALTQLGSTFAAPASGPPDYTKARLIFEIAGAQGDPVANCFLGSIHELGLGVPPSKPAALGYFKTAKAAGGCRGSDDAIARLTE
jgi:hypothetical protein